MFIVEVFDGTDWKEGSRHTFEVDALAQRQRFQDTGILDENLRITQKD